MTGEGILNILTDRLGNVWISTNKRVTCFNPLNESSTTYSVFDNLAVNSFIGGSCSMSKTGELFFGGNRGFCSFTATPSTLTRSLRKTQVYITDIRIQNVSVYNNPGEVQLDQSHHRLIIGHDQNSLEFEFSSLNYAAPSKVQYAYKLVGVDDDWNYTTSARRFASYNHLKKGTYRLLLKASDENGLWSDQVTTYEIIKKPAFYQTWWAQLIYGVLILTLLWLVYRFFVNRLRLREELRIARIEKEKSEELTQTKLRYFTNISHELLTPLTVITCLIDDLENLFKGKIWQHEVMKVNAQRLKRLLLQILDFRKVENGNMTLKVAEGDLVPFINHICQNSFLPLARDKQMDFSFVAVEKSIPAWFDAEKLDTVLFNLLSNAFKYTDSQGTIRVQVESFVRYGKRFARIRVSDTGRGIAEENMEHIFNRFYSNDPTNSVENHGIGLTLVKELLELHHATIKVESEWKAGSTFTIEMPIEKDANREDEWADKTLGQDEITSWSEEEAEWLDSETVEPVDKEDTTILIVEDNTELRILINRILGKRYHTLTASNGVEALALVEENPVDIIVSDIIMPEMDGLELCQRIKNNLNTSHIAVLLLTAKNSVNDRIDSYNAGAEGYLSKPFDLKVLEAKIRSLIRNRQKQTDQFKKNVELNITTLEFTSIDEKFLENAITVIESHLAEPDFDLDTFSGQLNMSKSSLYRKIKSLTGMSPVEFTKNIRLKHACQMLNKHSGNVSDVAYAVGFADPKYFTYCFKTEFGMTPTEYIKNSLQSTAFSDEPSVG